MNRITSISHSVATKKRTKKSIYTWFTGSTLIVLLIAVLVLNGRISTASSHEITQSFPLAYDATGAMLDAVVFPTYADQRIQSPFAQFDASAAMLDAVVFSHQVRPALQGLAYDATGAMLGAVVFPTDADQQVSIPTTQGLIYDATGAMLDAVVFKHQVRPALQGLAYDATGAMLNAVVFPTYADQQVNIPTSQGLAYDATGAMLDAVVFTHQVRPVSYPLWYDATEAMLEAVVFPKFPE
jgi:hypothetical protein